MFLLVKCNFVTNKTSAYRRGNGKRGRLLHRYGYNVTWAFGHLVQSALPEEYGIRGFHPENLPIIPRRCSPLFPVRSRPTRAIRRMPTDFATNLL